ncbi:MAG: type II toxin-antitoxin system VapC family toxin [Rhodospirillales bacterium]
MRLLLDTCTLLWWMSDDDRIPATVRSAGKSADNAVYVSVVSAWEVSIKERLKRFSEYPPGVGAAVLAAVGVYGFDVLPILWPHAARAGELALHHRDPFDRMLVAQAQVEKLTLATPDPLFTPYDVKLLWG